MGAQVDVTEDHQNNLRKIVKQRPSFLQRLASRNQEKAVEVTNHSGGDKEVVVDKEEKDVYTDVDETSVKTSIQTEYDARVKLQIGKQRSKIDRKSLQEQRRNDRQDLTRYNEIQDDEHKKIEQFEKLDKKQIVKTTIFDNVDYSTVDQKDDFDEVVCPQDSLSYVIPDSYQCDKYYTCRHGKQTTELCRDGFVFSISQVKCVLHRPELCEGRTGLQPPAGTHPCIRRNGIFHSSFDCNGFVRCTDNEPVFDSCPNGLVFDPRDRICGWPDEVLREDCFPRDLLQFQCPNITQTEESVTGQRSNLQFGPQPAS